MSPFTRWALFSLLLLLFSPIPFNSHQLKLAHATGLCSSSGNNGTDLVEEGMKLYPLIDENSKQMKKMMLVMNETRRKLGSFKICAPCTCCGKGICLASPCCYAIKCNIPNKPFGFCAFTPKACHCLRCHL